MSRLSAEEIVHDSRDRELGMHRKITRRDFLNGVAMTAGAAMMPWDLFAGGPPANPEKSPNYYPPALTGMRGSHPGSFDAAHSLRDGTFWDSAGKPEDTGETYDLIIVGGGISGLAAAHFYRKATGGKARILILDNHDDFGGHAKRNEFRVDNIFRLGFGGTFSIESPAPYSAVGHRRAVLLQVRKQESIFLSGPAPQDFLRQRNLRRRQTRDQSQPARWRRE